MIQQCIRTRQFRRRYSGSIEYEENQVPAGRLRGGEAQRVRDLPVLTLPIPALLPPLLHQAVLRAGNCTFQSPTMMKTTTKTLVQEYLPKTQVRATSTPALDRPQTWETPASSHHLLCFTASLVSRVSKLRLHMKY